MNMNSDEKTVLGIFSFLVIFAIYGFFSFTYMIFKWLLIISGIL